MVEKKGAETFARSVGAQIRKGNWLSKRSVQGLPDRKAY